MDNQTNSITSTYLMCPACGVLYQENEGHICNSTREVNYGPIVTSIRINGKTQTETLLERIAIALEKIANSK